MEEKLLIKTERRKNRDPSYSYLNVEFGDSRVGKARIKKIYRKIIINNINIFPEYERRGFATQVLNFFKENAREIIADRVRGNAIGFWEKMDFTDMGNGDYRWVSNGKQRAEVRRQRTEGGGQL